MKILDTLGRLLRLGAEAPGDPRRRRRAPPQESDYWYEVPGQHSLTGLPVTAETALRCAAVSRAVTLLSETIAGLPLVFYRKHEDGTRERLPDDYPVAHLLRVEPNLRQSPFEFREGQQAAVLLRGTGFAEIIRGPRTGYADRLEPLHPDRVRVEGLTNGSFRYVVTNPDGTQRVLTREQVFRVCGPGGDGLTGKTPIAHGRDTIGLALATEQFGARLFSQGALPGAVLEHPGRLGEEASKNLSNSWAKMHSGLGNAHRVAILEEGMKLNKFGMNAEDAQTLETRQFSVVEIARLFGVPPHLLFSLERSTNNNIEQQGIEFVKFTMLPIARRWEQAIRRDLIPDPDVYCEFLFDSLERADVKTRFEAYASAIQNGHLTRNEVRERENLEPLEGGDAPLRPANLTSPATGGRPPRGPAPPLEEGAGDDQGESGDDVASVNGNGHARSRLEAAFAAVELEAALAAADDSAPRP